MAKIAREERRLAQLQVQLEDCCSRLAALRDELAKLPPEPHAAEAVSDDLARYCAAAPATNVEKVAVFRSLFRGREDVFPRRWENTKSGRAGYSPACANEWAPGICEKKGIGPGGKSRAGCGGCRSRAFLPVTDDEIVKHLRGTHVMGIYPLLLDDTCWFLAADFDKKEWESDVAAFAETCATHKVPLAVERSRSGRGAHAWFFFSEPVPAATARKMGCFLITETMARRHQLSMESYDRLFPNQDTLPKGGFGNLIALPLQREARDRGNSVFVDASFIPHPDQWQFLAGIQRIASDAVQSMADAADRQGRVIGVRLSDTGDGDEVPPWEMVPSRHRRKIHISEPLPSAVRGVLCQRLFIEKAGLPSALLDQLKRLAAFQNPEFYKRQSMRLSTALTPRVIACVEELPEYVALPRGCLPAAEAVLAELGSRLAVEDKRVAGERLDVNFRGALTAVQEQAVRELLAHDTGVFVAPPGIGKTVVGINLIAARARSTLVLVHRKPLLDQWVAQIALFLGIESKAIGQVGAGKNKPNGRLDVAMLQSLVRKGKVNDVVASYGHVIVDECHHCPCVSFERVLAEVRARYITGLTATPQRRDGHHPIINMQIGPVRFAVDSRSQAGRRPFEHKLIVRETKLAATLPDGAGIQELYAALVADRYRNELILNDVIEALEARRSPILLTERRDHLEYLAERLQQAARNLVVLHGGMKPKERRDVLTRLASIPDGEERLLLATGRYIGEGFDDARLDTLFLALPVSWKGTLVQYAGRLHRLHPGKTEVRIYDYVDCNVPMLRKMFEKRLRGYRAIGYIQDEDATEVEPAVNEHVIEYDDDAME